MFARSLATCGAIFTYSCACGNNFSSVQETNFQELTSSRQIPKKQANKSFKIPLSFRSKSSENDQKSYNVVVIGGGSAGFACALEAKKLGLSVAMVNYVQPTEFGTKWGLGGTCLNVGCIPKYFYHQAADLRRKRDLRRVMGIETPLTNIDWEKMSNGIQNYISSESHKLTTLLREQKIKHYNRVGYPLSKNKIALLKNWDEMKENEQNGFVNANKINADYMLICTGERPNTDFKSIKGIETAITTDELFKIKTRPKNALILGGGYTAMEVASFFQGLGVNTTMFHRSQFLKSFDQELVSELVKSLESEGLKFRTDLKTINISHTEDHPSKINSGKGGNKIFMDGFYTTVSIFQNGDMKTEDYDVVVNSLSRKTDLRYLHGLQDKLKISDRGRIIGGIDKMMEKTSIPNIFAAGDVLHNSPRNEPSAAISGRRVARYIKAQIDEDVEKIKELSSFRFKNMPYCLFTSPEIAGFGLTEKKAKMIYKEEQVKSIQMKKTPYLEKLIKMNPLEPENPTNISLGLKSKTEKLPEPDPVSTKRNISQSQTDGQFERYVKNNILKIIYETKSGKDKILGMHYLGENAADIIQGYSVAHGKELTLQDLKYSSNIHPCLAEDFIKLAVIGENVAETPC